MVCEMLSGKELLSLDRNYLAEVTFTFHLRLCFSLCRLKDTCFVHLCIAYFGDTGTNTVEFLLLIAVLSLQYVNVAFVWLVCM